MTNTKQFLEEIHGTNTINFRALRQGKAVNINGLYNDNIKQQLEQLNRQGWNIHFVVNGGGNRNADITQINAVFVDFDYKNGKKSYPLEHPLLVGEKQKAVKKLNDFIYPASYIIETRNGIHGYWLIEEGATPEQFKQCQLQLINYFESDPAIKNLARLMRIPNYNHVKDTKNPYKCNIIDGNGDRYDIQDIMGALPTLSKSYDNTDAKQNCSLDNKKYIYNYIYYLGNKIDLTPQIRSKMILSIKNHDTSIKDIFNLPETIVTNNAEYMDAIQRFDLALLLGIENPQSFCCLFHDDKNPSASIFQDDNGHYVYTCHSSNCRVKRYNILNIIEVLGQYKSRPKAHEYIREILNVRIQETEWQKEQKEILDENIKFIMSREFRELYPLTAKHIDNYKIQLLQMHQIAKDNVHNEQLTDNEGLVTFFASTKYICEQLEIPTSRTKDITKRSALLQYHLLLNKLDRSQIPQEIQNRSAEERSKNSNKYQKSINCYSINSYTTLLLELAELQAIQWEENHYTMRATSREMFMRSEGKEVADWLYPQYKQITTTDAEGNKKVVDRTTSEKSDDRVQDITIALFNLLDKQGYAKESEIVEALQGKYHKKEIETQIKKCLNELLLSYDLKRVRLNKNLKASLGINTKGFPNIIIKNTEKAEKEGK